jgi:hypothetical protein
MTDLPWQAEDVLAVLAKSNVRPGKGVPVKTIWHSMSSGKDVSEGITHLVALKYVELNTSETDVILTELGYRVLRGETPKFQSDLAPHEQLRLVWGSA